jgi:hypothetical protein
VDFNQTQQIICFRARYAASKSYQGEYQWLLVIGLCRSDGENIQGSIARHS